MRFFIKALPLSNEMDIAAMKEDVAKVFNSYNLNIMFTISALPCKVSGASMPKLEPVSLEPVRFRREPVELKKEQAKAKKERRDGKKKDKNKGIQMKNSRGDAIKKEILDDSIDSGVEEETGFAPQKKMLPPL